MPEDVPVNTDVSVSCHGIFVARQFPRIQLGKVLRVCLVMVYVLLMNVYL